MASLLQRILGFSSRLRLDVGGPRKLVLADAPIWTMGVCAQPVVLDSGTPLEPCVGHVGRGARICELVSAGLRQSSGVRAVDQYRTRLDRLDRDVAKPLRRARRVRDA